MRIFRRGTNGAATAGTDTAEDPASAPGIAEELAVLERVCAHGSSVAFGAPSRCPDCRCYGFVEGVDHVAGVTDNRCPSCAATWRITRRALVRRAVTSSAEPVRAIGDGVLVRSLAA